MKGNVYLDLMVQKLVSSIQYLRIGFNLWPVLGEKQSQLSGRAVVSVECSSPHRRWIFEISIGYRMGLNLF